jgi:PilZ domain-containing protein
MDGERRQSMRVTTRLPCQWHILAARPARHELLALFNLPGAATITPKLSSLNDEIQSALHTLDNNDVRHVLALLNSKIDLLSQAMLDSQLPPVQPVGLSLSGLDVLNPRAIMPGTWVGVHLVLEDGYQLVESGQVSRCSPKGQEFVIGIALAQMEPQNARKLARFVMRQPLDNQG